MQTIGERLEEARKRKGISIREAAEATKIRGDYLQKFENNQFDLSLADLYVRGFLRSYAQFLKLPADKIVNDYNALGPAAAGRPQKPGREVYGRMDLSVSSVGEDAPPAPVPAAEAESAPAARRVPPSFTRGGGTLDSDPAINPATLVKIGIAAAGALGLVLLVFGIKAMVGSNGAKTPPPETTKSDPPVLTQPAERTFKLVALDTVRVRVTRKNPDGSAGEVLFNGTLARDQTAVVPHPGPVYITPTAAENLEIEINGKRYPTRQRGYTQMELPAQ